MDGIYVSVWQVHWIWLDSNYLCPSMLLLIMWNSYSYCNYFRCFQTSFPWSLTWVAFIAFMSNSSFYLACGWDRWWNWFCWSISIYTFTGHWMESMFLYSRCIGSGWIPTIYAHPSFYLYCGIHIVIASISNVPRHNVTESSTGVAFIAFMSIWSPT